MNISSHFTLEEFTFSDTAARRGIDNTPPAEVIETLRRTAANLELVRSVLGDVAIRVTSGFRCVALNRAIGSKDTSAHVRGLAVDFVAPGFGTPAAICRKIDDSLLAFDQLIHEHTWVHIAWPAPDRMARREVLTLMAGGKYAPGIIERAVA